MDSPTSSSSSSPSSISSSESLLTFHKNCQICSQPVHGKHFGAYSCRACSAFFRRAVLGKYDTLMCREADGKCEATPDGRFICKKCRVLKCYKVGMTADKLQHDRDLIYSTENVLKKRKLISTIPRSPENTIGRPSFIFLCEPDLAATNRTIIDVQFLIDRANRIFISNSKSKQDQLLGGMTQLSRLSYAMNLSRIPTAEKPVMFNKIGKEETMVFWENRFLTTAKWLTYCDAFQKLSPKLKIDFLKSIWLVWMNVERVGREAEKRIIAGEIDNIIHCMSNIYIDVQKLEMDHTWMSNYKPEQIKYFVEKPCNVFQDSVMEPLVDISASSQEITYLICVVSFRFAAKQLSGKIAEVVELLIDELADDLHNYYRSEMKIKNYASRIARLMKIVQSIEQDIYERKQRAEIARIFDVFIYDFSHPEMFFGM